MKEKKLNGKLLIKNKDKYLVFNNETISSKRKKVMEKRIKDDK